MFVRHRQLTARTLVSDYRTESGGRCQWVLDTVRQTGESLSHCSSILPPSVPPLTKMSLTMSSVRATLAGTDRVQLTGFAAKAPE
jgi:hypothetical protein